MSRPEMVKTFVDSVLGRLSISASGPTFFALQIPVVNGSGEHLNHLVTRMGRANYRLRHFRTIYDTTSFLGDPRIAAFGIAAYSFTKEQLADLELGGRMPLEISGTVKLAIGEQFIDLLTDADDTSAQIGAMMLVAVLRRANAVGLRNHVIDNKLLAEDGWHQVTLRERAIGRGGPYTLEVLKLTHGSPSGTA